MEGLGRSLAKCSVRCIGDRIPRLSKMLKPSKRGELSLSACSGAMAAVRFALDCLEFEAYRRVSHLGRSVVLAALGGLSIGSDLHVPRA
jgi:hypothetical protein